MRTLKTKVIGRIREVSDESLKAWLYFILMMLSLKIDEIHCNYLVQFYGTEDYFLKHMRGGIAISISLIFGVVDLILSYLMYQKAKNNVIAITFVDGKFKDITGLTKILSLIGLYFMMISAISLAYDFYEIIFVHVLGRVL